MITKGIINQEELFERFKKVVTKKPDTQARIAKEIQISIPTLFLFLNKKEVGFLSLSKIKKWVDKNEE